MKPIKFVFDLDRTISEEDLVEVLFRNFDIRQEVKELSREIEDGNIPFIEGFIKKCR